jgi:hypothetical protein
MRQAFVGGQIPGCRGRGRSGGWQCRALGGVRTRSGYFGRMARPGRSEDTSVPIWLKLSAVDSAKMDQVLARPEFEGWTKGEWCLEIIQTALRYYTRPRPAGEPGRRRAPARPATAPVPPPAEAVPPPAEAVPSPAEPVPPPAEASSPPDKPAPPRARPARTAARRPPPVKRTSPSHEPEPVVPERPQPPEPGQLDTGQPDTGQPDTGQLDPAEVDQLSELECSHPAEARDYQSGTCVACGAILWD